MKTTCFVREWPIGAISVYDVIEGEPPPEFIVKSMASGEMRIYRMEKKMEDQTRSAIKKGLLQAKVPEEVVDSVVAFLEVIDDRRQAEEVQKKEHMKTLGKIAFELEMFNDNFKDFTRAIRELNQEAFHTQR